MAWRGEPPAEKPEVEIGDFFKTRSEHSTVVLKAFFTKPSIGRVAEAQPACADEAIPPRTLLGPVVAVDVLEDQVAVQVPHPLHEDNEVWISVWRR